MCEKLYISLIISRVKYFSWQQSHYNKCQCTMDLFETANIRLEVLYQTNWKKEKICKCFHHDIIKLPPLVFTPYPSQIPKKSYI